MVVIIMLKFKQHKSHPKPVDGFISAQKIPTGSFKKNHTNGSEVQPLILSSQTLCDQPNQSNNIFAPQSHIEQPSSLTEKPEKIKRARRRIRISPKILVRLCAVFIGLFVLSYIASTGYAWVKAKSIFRGGADGAVALQKDIQPSQLNGEGDGRVNVLLLGKGGIGHEAPDLTDTIMVASIDPLKNDAALLSIPRDLWVKNPESGEGMKLNSIYASEKERLFYEAGLTEDVDNPNPEIEDNAIASTKSIISTILGIPVHYYVMIDFTAFKQAIDVVGGVDIDVKEDLIDYNVAWELGGNPVIARKGIQHMDGTRALFYSRSRYGSNRGDFDRAERQRQMIQALKDKVLSIGTFSNPLKVSQLVGTFGNHVRTDIGLTNGELTRFYDLAKSIGPDSIKSISLADEPDVLVETSMIGDSSVVVPIEGVFEYFDIRSFVRNSIRDSFLNKEDASVAVFNGTNFAGQASKYTKELKSYGYKITATADAPTSDYTKTILVDMSKDTKPFTKNYLEKRLKTTAVSSVPNGIIVENNTDFVIIIGTDAVEQ
jgi:polyisoprenyl-teichoic acid--peptidoglycan teichoic acid transferase